MNISIFNNSISDVEKILKESILFKSKGVKPIGETSEEFKSISLKGTYFGMYRLGVTNLDYDFLLNDESFFQFSFNKNEKEAYPSIRYAFFQNPREYVTYEEYLQDINFDFLEVGYSLLEDYQQSLTENEINSNSTMIRYDLDHVNYKPLIHATSHLHIGNSEYVRIPCNRIMTPLAFTIFVIKNIYYGNWKTIISNIEKFEKDYLTTMKSSCTFIQPNFWKYNPEAKEFYLS